MKTLTVDDAWDIYNPVLILDSRRAIVKYSLSYVQRSQNLKIELSYDGLFICFPNSDVQQINKFLNRVITAYNTFSEVDREGKNIIVFGQIEDKAKRLLCTNGACQIVSPNDINPIAITRGIMLSKNLALV